MGTLTIAGQTFTRGTKVQFERWTGVVTYCPRDVNGYCLILWDDGHEAEFLARELDMVNVI